MISPFIASCVLAFGASTPIFDIQGAALLSPYAGEAVTTRGIVTVVASNGFYLQDAFGDGDDATSDGVFVYTGAPPVVLPGDEAEVDGTVTEYLPGGDADNLTVTEIHPARVRVLARGRNLPYPVVIGTSGRVPPPDVMEGSATYDADNDGIDFWESLEGMRVRLAAPRVVGPANAYGEVWVVANGAASGMSERGSLVSSLRDANPERVQIDDVLLPAPMPSFQCGDQLDDILGVVDYRFGCFQVLPLEPPLRTTSGPAPDVSGLADADGRTRVAAFNVRNLTPSDPARTRRLAEIIAINLQSPAIVALEEIQDSNGRVDDATTSAAATLDSLTAAIIRAGGAAYAACDIAPVDGADGGEPGGNIRVALLYDATRVTLVRRGAPSPLTATFPVASGDSVALTISPGRVDPANPAWDDARKPLAAEFRVNGEPLFVIACHFSSRSGTTPDFGAVQPPLDPRAAKRFAQSQAVRDFVQSILRIDPDARVVAAGDFNDDYFSGALAPLSSSTALYDLHWRLPENERYSYLYQGNAHAYDRIMVSPSLVAGGEMDVVHVCAEFSDGASDHDPVLASLVVDHAAPPRPREGAPHIQSISPNPSSGMVRIVVGGGPVNEAEVFDARGGRVRLLAPAPGATELLWDGNGNTGRRVASGVYFVRVRNPAGSSVQRVVRVPSH